MANVKTRERSSGRKNPGGWGRSPKPVGMGDVLEWRGDPDDPAREIGYTVAERIVDDVRRFNSIDEAVAAAGVRMWVYREWLREGARWRAELAAAHAEGRPRPVLRGRAAAQLWFAEAIDQAKAEAERRLVGVLYQHATGDGLMNAVVTRELAPDPDGRLDDAGRPIMVEVKRTEKQNRVLPNADIALKVLARKAPERWGNVERHEHTGLPGGDRPIEHVHRHDVPALTSLIDALASKITNPIDTTAAEIPELPSNDDG